MKETQPQQWLSLADELGVDLNSTTRHPSFELPSEHSCIFDAMVETLAVMSCLGESVTVAEIQEWINVKPMPEFLEFMVEEELLRSNADKFSLSSLGAFVSNLYTRNC